jgi:hypothetical protein
VGLVRQAHHKKPTGGVDATVFFGQRVLYTGEVIEDARAEAKKVVYVKIPDKPIKKAVTASTVVVHAVTA